MTVPMLRKDGSVFHADASGTVISIRLPGAVQRGYGKELKMIDEICHIS